MKSFVVISVSLSLCLDIEIPTSTETYIDNGDSTVVIVMVIAVVVCLLLIIMIIICLKVQSSRDRIPPTRAAYTYHATTEGFTTVRHGKCSLISLILKKQPKTWTVLKCIIKISSPSRPWHTAA